MKQVHPERAGEESQGPKRANHESYVPKRVALKQAHPERAAEESYGPKRATEGSYVSKRIPVLIATRSPKKKAVERLRTEESDRGELRAQQDPN